MKQAALNTSKPQPSGFTRTASTKKVINTPNADTRRRDGMKVSPGPKRISFAADSTSSRTSSGATAADTLPKAILKNKSPAGNNSAQKTPSPFPEEPKPRFPNGIHPSPGPTQTAALLPSVPDLSFSMNGTSANCDLPQMPATPRSDASAFFPPPSSLMSAISFADPQVTPHPGMLSPQQVTPSFGPSPLFVTPPRERQSAYSFPGSGFTSHPTNLFDNFSYPEVQRPMSGIPDAGVNFMFNPFVNRSPPAAASSYDAYMLQKIQFQEDQIRLLRGQLQRCTELYSSLYARTFQNVHAKSESASQTDGYNKSFADASTMVEEQLIGNGSCTVTGNPVLPLRPLENRNSRPVTGHVTPEQQAYLEMMANIQIALQNSGSNNAATQRSEMPTQATPSDGSSDVSILCGNLAKQYLNLDMHCVIGKTNRLALEQASFYGMHGSDVSFATKNYLERHGLTKNSVARNGFLRTESIIEWSEEDDAEWDGNSRVQYFQDARRDAYFRNGQQIAGGHLHARRAAVLGGKENRPT